MISENPLNERGDGGGAVSFTRAPFAPASGVRPGVLRVALGGVDVVIVRAHVISKCLSFVGSRGIAHAFGRILPEPGGGEDELWFAGVGPLLPDQVDDPAP